VAQRFKRLFIVLTVLAGAGCSRLDERLQQHREKLESLGATTAAVSEAWLAGSVSGIYARTALEQTYMLLGQERTALTSEPQALVDPRGARLSEAAERMSRHLAALIDDVRRADGASVRASLTRIPIAPSERK
jgi:hypothetical protein